MASSVCLYDHGLIGEDRCVLRRVSDFEVEGQRKKGKRKRTWRQQVEEEGMKVGLSREDVLCCCRSQWIVGQ